MRIKLLPIFLLSGALLAGTGCLISWGAPAASPRNKNWIIVAPNAKEAAFAETLAAKEIRRYIYLRTGLLLPILDATAGAASGANLIVVASKNQKRENSLILDPDARIATEQLQAEQFLVKTTDQRDRKQVVIIGGDPVGTLYGAYRFAEYLDVRFYLDGDVVPDVRTELLFPPIDEVAKPLLANRGILPFHDFPEGPDWWTADAYKAVIAQLPKLRMNFIGLHTYSEGGPIAEPTVWIGPGKDVGNDGAVQTGYPASYYNTLREGWGFQPKKTSDFSMGTSELFDRDSYGAIVAESRFPEPPAPEAENELFNKTGVMLRDAFQFGHQIGVKSAVGTETPLTIPKALQERLRSEGKNPKDPRVVEGLYQGIFHRIKAAYLIDYYWLWTPESWEWEGTTRAQGKAAVSDIKTAMDAARREQAPFTLAVSGWILGRNEDSALFDRELPKEVPISSLVKQLGKDPVNPEFAKMAGRSKWAIPWLEDDQNLSAPQLWVGRMRKDAADAVKYGCDGLIGIQWRTRSVGPNVSALAQAQWDQNGWTPLPGGETQRIRGGDSANKRYLPTGDFYLDWAEHQFGREIKDRAAQIFELMDGWLPQPSEWTDGPGGLKPNPAPWETIQRNYTFIDEFEKLRPMVRGDGNLERFDYWLNSFRYMLAIEKLKSAWAKGDTKAMTDSFSEVYKYLLATVSSVGDLGMVANWEAHILPSLNIHPDKSYSGPARVIVPTVRTQVAEGEGLDLKVLILSEQPPRDAMLFYRTIGGNHLIGMPLTHVARGVYSVKIPPSQDKDFEYYVEVTPVHGAPIRFPATAPKMNQTVVVTPRPAK